MRPCSVELSRKIVSSPARSYQSTWIRTGSEMLSSNNQWAYHESSACRGEVNCDRTRPRPLLAPFACPPRRNGDRVPLEKDVPRAYPMSVTKARRRDGLSLSMKSVRIWAAASSPKRMLVLLYRMIPCSRVYGSNAYGAPAPSATTSGRDKAV